MAKRLLHYAPPPAPPMVPGAPCFFGKGSPAFGQQPAPFPPMWGQNFCGRGFGHQGWHGPSGGQFQPFGMPQDFCRQWFGQGREFAFGPKARGPRGEQFQHHGRFSPDMQEEVRAKAVEAAKLRIDLEDVLSRKPLNREKALELNGQIGKLEQEVKTWRFEQKLNRIEEFNKGAEEQSIGK